MGPRQSHPLPPGFTGTPFPPWTQRKSLKLYNASKAFVHEVSPWAGALFSLSNPFSVENSLLPRVRESTPLKCMRTPVFPVEKVMLKRSRFFRYVISLLTRGHGSVLLLGRDLIQGQRLSKWRRCGRIPRGVVSAYSRRRFRKRFSPAG